MKNDEFAIVLFKKTHRKKGISHYWTGERWSSNPDDAIIKNYREASTILRHLNTTSGFITLLPKERLYE